MKTFQEIFDIPKKYYLGIKEIEYRWHGEWADATIVYKGHEINVTILEDSLYGLYCEEEQDQTFEEYLQNNTELIFCELDDIIFNLDSM